MAVPKKKTSKSKRDMRRAHDALTPGMSVCPECKEPKQSHRVCPSCGVYKGRKEIKAAAE